MITPHCTEYKHYASVHTHNFIAQKLYVLDLLSFATAFKQLNTL